ncbi:hypothetical protein [Micromonospora foliorum]|uniref:hypothetical protein n=1 Tax=Micromonospora foliorum TaxID=2911210 RepID=UPI001EE8DB12|nr:hypothetical protein [Micromonospora foliorum]MCG5439965.1 hypothetical protein [Micromonospora foliorum]
MLVHALMLVVARTHRQRVSPPGGLPPLTLPPLTLPPVTLPPVTLPSVIKKFASEAGPQATQSS